MKISLDKEEMRREWLVRRHRVAMRGDVSLTVSGGIDLNAVAEREMRGWYVELLRLAPADMLSVSDVAPLCRLTVDDDGVGSVTLPGNVVRVLGVESDGWRRPATVVSDMGVPMALLQRGEYSRGGEYNPVALWEGDRLTLYSFDTSPGSNPSLTRLLCVVDPGNEVYEMDERALGLIEPR